MKKDITEKNYYQKCKKYECLPVMPEELYSGFRNLKIELLQENENSIRRK
jgi:hypothetical protein